MLRKAVSVIMCFNHIWETKRVLLFPTVFSYVRDEQKQNDKGSFSHARLYQKRNPPLSPPPLHALLFHCAKTENGEQSTLKNDLKMKYPSVPLISPSTHPGNASRYFMTSRSNDVASSPLTSDSSQVYVIPAPIDLNPSVASCQANPKTLKKKIGGWAVRKTIAFRTSRGC